MIRNPLRFVLFFAVLLVLQITVLNHVEIDGYLIPYVYVVGVASLPFVFGRAKAMLAGFAVGAVMDLFLHTGGLHAMACVWVVYLCAPLSRVFFRLSGKDLDGFDPFDAKNSRTRALALLFALLLVHGFVLYFCETIRFSALAPALWHAAADAALSFVVSLVALSFFEVKNNRRVGRGREL